MHKKLKRTENDCPKDRRLQNGTCQKGYVLGFTSNWHTCCRKRGWMAKDDDMDYDVYDIMRNFLHERYFSRSDDNKKILHKFTARRVKWLTRWLGRDCIEMIINNEEQTDVCLGLLKFLDKHWDDLTHFYPFIGIDDAKTLVIGDPSTFIIRFSGSTCGSIVLTYYGVNRGKIFNIVGLITPRGEIYTNIDGELKTYDNIHKLSVAFSLLKYRQKKIMLTAEAYVSNNI